MPSALTDLHWSTYLFLAIHFAIQVMLGLRVVMRRRPVGETLAWILLVFVFPVVGPFLYLLLGELRLGQRRAKRFEEISPPFLEWLEYLRERLEDQPLEMSTRSQQLAHLAE